MRLTDRSVGALYGISFHFFSFHQKFKLSANIYELSTAAKGVNKIEDISL